MIDSVTISASLQEMGRLFGLVGFGCLSLLIFSGEVARFADRWWGIDRIIKFQRKFSLFTALFIFLHPLFFILADWRASRFLIPDGSIWPLTLGTLALYSFIIILIASKIYKRIPHLVWQYLHILTYALFFLAFGHAINISRSQDLLYFKILFGLIFVCLIGGIIYRTQYKIRARFFGNKFYVEEIKQENTETFQLKLNSKKPFKFKAGQFCFLRLNKNHLYARHPFTITSAPDNQTLDFIIKKTGRFTSTLATLKKGEEVIVEGPFGRFVADRTKASNLVFIAGGVGLAPFISLLRDQANHPRSKKILLLYGVPSPTEILFKTELESFDSAWFSLVYVFSQTSNIEALGESGYITKTLIEKYIQTIDQTSFYICGPEVLKTQVNQALYDLGVNHKNIIIEDFFW